MNYHNIQTVDMLNGDGLRVTLFVSGCSHHCPECQNPQTHSLLSGIEFDRDALEELREELSKPHISGITFSGGDPLHVKNRAQTAEIIRCLADILHAQKKTVWIYTGYLWDDIKDCAAVQMADVVVDGEYIAEKNDVNYPWCGSTNQRVIDVKRSLEEGKVILHV